MCKAQQQVSCSGTAVQKYSQVLKPGESCDNIYETINGISKQCIEAHDYPQFDCMPHQQKCDDPH